jgi:hypothetical protein
MMDAQFTQRNGRAHRSSRVNIECLADQRAADHATAPPRGKADADMDDHVKEVIDQIAKAVQVISLPINSASTGPRRLSATAKAIQERLDVSTRRLSERSVDIETCDRHVAKLREELTLVRIECHSGQVDELDVEGIWPSQDAYCRARGTCRCRHRPNSAGAFSSCRFPEDCVRGKSVSFRTAPTVCLQLVRPVGPAKAGLMDLAGASWN